MARRKKDPFCLLTAAVPVLKAEDGFLLEKKLLAFDDSFRIRPLAGLDEAGRGPLAGPLVAAAVVLDPAQSYPDLDDSKKMKPKARETAFELISIRALAVAVAVKTPEEVDLLNPLKASLLAMEEALNQLKVKPLLALVDGNVLPHLSCQAEAVVHGDGLSLSIAAASIVAKVTRDRMMLLLHEQYPQYGFDQHKGYGTKAHYQALDKYGPSPVHRFSYRGVSREGLLF